MGIGWGQGKGGRGYGLDLQVERKTDLELPKFRLGFKILFMLFIQATDYSNYVSWKKIRKANLLNDVMVVSVLRIPVFKI